MLNCPICHSADTKLFLKREHVPANQNLVVNSSTEALQIPRGTLNLSLCSTCGFVFNSAFDLSLIHYGDNYDNTQNLSSSFQIHLSNLVDSLIFNQTIQNHQIVEVGCGKGSFLKSLVFHPKSQNSGVGFDPSYMGPLSLGNGRLQFNKTFYDESHAHIQADIVICRHVIEHISQPVNLLKSIRKALTNSPNARLFFETPCLEWILKNRVVWDFFYEHCSYYTKDSLSLAFEMAAFQVDEVKHVFGGQYLWLEASLGNRKRVAESTDGISDLISNYIDSEYAIKNKWLNQINSLRGNWKIAIWGAGAKGVTFANLFDPHRDIFDCIIDLNPNKQNHYLPGTGHPIVGFEQLKTRNIKYAIVMNPNYFQENENLLKSHSISTNLVNLHE
jgi:SAM-dependent methyltransferase